MLGSSFNSIVASGASFKMNYLYPDMIKQNLIEEFKQAWEHYRHVEWERDTFIGFALTLIVGMVAYLSKIIGGTTFEKNIPYILLISNTILILLLFLLFAIIKCEHVLNHYLKVRQTLRIFLEIPEKMISEIDIKSSPDKILQSKIFRHQNIGLYIISIYCIFTVVFHIIILLNMLNTQVSFKDSIFWIFWLSIPLVIFIVYIRYLIIFKYKNYFKKKFTRLIYRLTSKNIRVQNFINKIFMVSSKNDVSENYP